MTKSDLAALPGGVLFGFGLAWATMTKPEVVLSFLEFRDFGLLAVLGGAMAVTFVAFRLVPRLLRKPVAGASFGRHVSLPDRKVVVGAALFGVGWGLCGVCPGPALASLGLGNWPTLFALAGIFAGALLHGLAQRPPAAPPR